MIDQNHIKLKATSILKVPLEIFYNDFTFNVNGELYNTCHIIADLLSPKICRLHSCDPTFDKFSITTSHKGNFSYILNLIKFEDQFIPENELDFISEVLAILDNDSIEVHQQSNGEITKDNILELLIRHQKSKSFFSSLLQKEIDYLSSHFYEMDECSEEFSALNLDVIEEVLRNPKLQLESEDQLITFVNQLYIENPINSFLYEYVDFTNASSTKISDFLNIFDFNAITNNIWKMLSFRLEHQIIKDDEINSRYFSKNENINDKSGISLPYRENKEFNGIINYLSTQSRGNIFSKINITASSIASQNESFSPINSILYEDETRYFLSSCQKNSWLCFDFKKFRVIPSYYTIRSFGADRNDGAHPKSWVIEGSNNNDDWVILDQKKDCSLLNGRNIVQTFKIDNPNNQKFRFLRMRQTKFNWVFSDCLCIDSIEFYGTLI